MKKGSRVYVKDNSYAVIVEATGFSHDNVRFAQAHDIWTVLASGLELPAETDSGEVNDTVISRDRDGKIAFIQACLLYEVKNCPHCGGVVN